MNKIDKSLFIAIVIIAYIALMTGLYYGADSFIQDKDEKLRKQAREALDRYFNKDRERKYVDLHYNANKVGYEEVSIPKIIEPSYTDILGRIRTAKEYLNKNESEEEAKQEILKNRKKMWDDKFGSYSMMYDLDVDPEASNITQKGWALRIIERMPIHASSDGYYEYYLYPYQVAYKKTGFFTNPPNIETAVQESLSFMTENDKSWLKEYYGKGSTKHLLSDMNNQIDNEYYHILQDTEGIIWWKENKVWWNQSKDEDIYGLNRYSLPVENGSMFNGYYEVLFKRTQPTTYSIKWVGEETLEKDKNDIIIWGSVLLTLVMLIVATPLWRKVQKENKLKNETLYEKLLHVCSPTNYMKPYNQGMIEKANSLFVRLKETAPDDIEKLKEIRQETSKTLGISFLDKNKIAELKNRCNPKNFMTPYQPEKLSIANDLYSRLSSETLSVDEVEDIALKIKELSKG